jgi:hypothetical protein
MEAYEGVEVKKTQAKPLDEVKAFGFRSQSVLLLGNYRLLTVKGEAGRTSGLF